MPYTKEQIAQANSINLIDYAAAHGYQLESGGRKSLHVKHSGGLYLFTDSNKYYHHSTDSTGGPIDFIMQFENMGFVQAVKHLIGVQPNIGNYTPQLTAVKKDKGAMTLPDKARNYKRVYWYLCTARGIEPEIVSRLMKEKKIYQQAGRGNCVFVGYDEKGTPRYCSKRGTSLDKPYKGDEDNSDKSYPFSMEGVSNRLYVMESAIDVMSHASLFKLRGLDYTQDHRISLGCLSDRALEWYLSQHPEIKQIIFGLDNDADGRGPDGLPCNHGQEVARKLCERYEKRGYDTAIQTPEAKDFNEDLVNVRKPRYREHESAQEDEDEWER
ncbi:MAG: DUF3991 and toprim domain-containing protein [Clostridiales bacterium]|nr:DUF3991 and toprim domain-containing protein [Clostridiales bacterium]